MNLPRAIMIDGVWYYARKDGWYPHSVTLPEWKILWKWKRNG